MKGNGWADSLAGSAAENEPRGEPVTQKTQASERPEFTSAPRPAPHILRRIDLPLRSVFQDHSVLFPGVGLGEVLVTAVADSLSLDYQYRHPGHQRRGDF
jgi:hypothetical protein